MSALDRVIGNGVSASSALAPPHSLEAEQSVLGAVLLSEKVMYPLVIEEGLKAEDFYRERNQLVFAAMLALYGESEPIDVLTVSEHLRSKGLLEQAGGQSAIDSLVASVPAAGNARHYARIVREHALVRRLLTTTYDIQARVQEQTAAPRELVEQAERAMLEVAHDDRQKDFRSIEEVLDEELDKLHRLSLEGTALTGTPSGFKDLDEMTGGFQPGNLVIIAARPSMGKSALVCNIAENAAIEHNAPVALFSLEMSETELAQRFVASQARIKGDELRKGRVAEHKRPKILEASQRLARAPLYIDDSSDVGMLEIRAKARRLHQQHGLGLIIIDYLQLLRADARIENRVEAIGQMSRGLKILARELRTPVIALSQLNRGVESRTDKRPVLSDLRESGCLTGETLVTLADTGERVEIQSLVGRHGVRVMALDTETWKLEPRDVTNAFSTGTKPVHKLTLRSGRTIRATANHKFRTVDGWRRLDQLSPKDRIATPRALPGGGEPTMTHDELGLLGHLIGDGCTLPRQPIHYTTVDPEVAEHVAALATRVFGASVAPRVSPERSWIQVYLPATRPLGRGIRNPIAEWLDGLGVFGLRSHEKRVPEAVFAQPVEGIAVFLRHLWATDGCIWHKPGPGRARIYYASSSERLARDVQALLLRCDIRARIGRVAQRAGRPQFHVDVSGAEDVQRFLAVVGGFGRQRQEAAARIGAAAPARGNTNRDVVPREAWESLVKPAMARNGVTARAMQAQIGTQYCGSTLYRAAMSRERAARVAEAVDDDCLRRLACSDVYWDEVVAIEPDGVEEAFDLTVDGLHNFVAGDIVVHNSIEQDADLVAFIYRDEYYDRESEREGEADIIIAKHRNGAIGDVVLTFQKEYPKFLNYAGERYA